MLNPNEILRQNKNTSLKFILRSFHTILLPGGVLKLLKPKKMDLHGKETKEDKRKEKKSIFTFSKSQKSLHSNYIFGTHSFYSY